MDLKKKIHLQNQKIQLLKSRISLEQKELERLHSIHVEVERTKLLRKWLPKIKDKFYSYPEDLISAILTIAKCPNSSHQIEIRNINYDVKFYYLDKDTGKMKCIR